MDGRGAGREAVAEQELVRSKPADVFDAEAIRALVERLGPMEAVLADASYEAKAGLYNSLGLELTFDARPEGRQRRGLAGVLRIVSEEAFTLMHACSEG